MSSINNISLFIPHVFANYTQEDVVEVFDNLNLGKIKNVDFVSKLTNQDVEYNAVYVHFERWYDNDYAIAFQKRVIDPNQEARIVYDKPWFWIVLENKAKKFVSGDRKPRIDLGDLVKKSVPEVVVAPPIAPCMPPIAPCMPPIAPCMPTFKQVVENAAKHSAIKDKDKDKDKKMELEFEDEEMTAEDEELEAAMDEMEDAMDENECNLITIDWRYVNAMEHENAYMRMEIDKLRATLIHVDRMYQAEIIKSKYEANADGNNAVDL